MKKIFLLILILLLSISMFGCVKKGNVELPKDIPQQTDESDKSAIASLVEEFGKKLQIVSLQAPKDIVKESIQENYSNYVSTTLLSEWMKNPERAPGRLTSSPWPDRIEIISTEILSENAYQVKGEIIEVTNTGEIAAKRPITLHVEKYENKWLISAVALGSYEKSDSHMYQNTEYGFNFSLPKSWKDYSIINEKWEGISQEDQQDGKAVEAGPIISIRHPQWTTQNQRQDIPIMVFTLNQWNSLQKEEFYIGAAPIGPSELGRNSKYVFALPARYNYAFPIGYEEVEDIIKSNPLITNQ
ncbi:MAG: hypothetical protein K0S61_1950 [Anaerocolumna sp.]|jgi:predicted small lipoprotein YifL|nr:hypothetical protein [Anaerocolumna sp.]